MKYLKKVRNRSVKMIPERGSRRFLRKNWKERIKQKTRLNYKRQMVMGRQNEKKLV